MGHSGELMQDQTCGIMLVQNPDIEQNHSTNGNRNTLPFLKINESRLWQCVHSMDEVCWGWCDTAVTAI